VESTPITTTKEGKNTQNPNTQTEGNEAPPHREKGKETPKCCTQHNARLEE